MASSDSDSSQDSNHDVKTTTIWGVILCVAIIVIVAAICFVHRSLRGQAIRRALEAQLPRYNISSGLGKETVESMPIITFNPRIHSQKIPVPAPALMSLSEETKPLKRGPRLVALRSFFTIQNISCGSSGRNDGATIPPGDSTSAACSICTEDFIEGARLRMLPCGHLYHPQCIDQWLTDRSRTCPLCRVNLGMKKPPPAFIENV
jgi:RING finger protein 165